MSVTDCNFPFILSPQLRLDWGTRTVHRRGHSERAVGTTLRQHDFASNLINSRGQLLNLIVKLIVLYLILVN